MPSKVNMKQAVSAFAIYNQQKTEGNGMDPNLNENNEVEVIDSNVSSRKKDDTRKTRRNRKPNVDDDLSDSSVSKLPDAAVNEDGSSEKEEKKVFTVGTKNGEIVANATKPGVKRKRKEADEPKQPSRKVNKRVNKVDTSSTDGIVVESIEKVPEEKIVKKKKKQKAGQNNTQVSDVDDSPSISESVSEKSQQAFNSESNQTEKIAFKEILNKDNHCILPVSSVNSCKTFKNFVSRLNFNNSVEASQEALNWLIFPVRKAQFQQQIWESKPYYINRSTFSTYYEGLLSTSDFEQIIDNHELEYGVNIDVTRYVDNERETLNPDGRVNRHVIWDYYKTGCSIRMLNPQSYSDSVWRLTSTLQEFFGTFVGANLYLTPPGTQGFAPHYDDIEAFVLQLEGRKRWYVYEPKQVLPRYSSRNFTPDEVGQLILTVDLNPGDLLYMPRGFIHQASCLPDHHSLHLTVSSTQLNSFVDLFERMVPHALKIAAETDVEFRRSLPLDYMQYMGIVHEDSAKKNPARLHFNAQIKTLWKRLAEFLPLDSACDQMSKKFIHDSQPPALTEDEINHSVLNKAGQTWNNATSAVSGDSKPIDLKTEVRLIRNYCLRLLMEGENESVVYYNVDNSRVYHGKDMQKLDVTPEEAACIDHLIKTYPFYCKVSSLPVLSGKDKVELCRALYDRRLMTVKDFTKKSSNSQSD